MARRKKSIIGDSVETLDTVVEEQEDQEELRDPEEDLSETFEDWGLLSDGAEPETLEEPQETAEVTEEKPQEDEVGYDLIVEPEVHPIEVEPKEKVVREAIQKQRPKPRKSVRKSNKNQLKFVR